MTDEEEVQALLERIPDLTSHLPDRLVADDLGVLIDAWKSVREPPSIDPDRRGYYGGLASDMILIEELYGRLNRFRSERLWWLSLPHSYPATGLDREVILDAIESLARLLVDDSAQYALLKTVDDYRLRKRHQESDDDAIERQTLAELRAMSRHRWNEKTKIVQAVRADLLAGRMSRVDAIERIGLPAWTALCSTLSDEDLQRVLDGDA